MSDWLKLPVAWCAVGFCLWFSLTQEYGRILFMMTSGFSLGEALRITIDYARKGRQ